MQFLLLCCWLKGERECKLGVSCSLPCNEGERRMWRGDPKEVVVVVVIVRSCYWLLLGEREE